MIEVLEARIAPAVVLTNLGQLNGDPTGKDLVATDSVGNIFVVGRFTGTLDVNVRSGTAGPTTADTAGDLFIAKYSRDHQLLWFNRWGGSGSEDAQAIVTDSSGDVYIGGQFGSSNAGFPSGTSFLNATAASPQGFIIKLNGATGAADSAFDSDGQLAFGNGTDPSGVTSLAYDPNGAILATGFFNGANNGINGPILSTGLSAAEQDAFIARIDAVTGLGDADFGPNGARAFNPINTAIDTPFKIQLDSGGNIFVGISSFIPSSSTATALVMKIDGADFSPVSGFGSGGLLPITSGDDAVDFTLDSAGNVYAARSNGSDFITTFKFSGSDGQLDTAFGSGGVSFIPVKAISVSLTSGPSGVFYVSGETASKTFVARFAASGAIDSSFGSAGVLTLGSLPAATIGNAEVGFALAPNGDFIVRDAYIGSPDFAPGSAVQKLPAATTANPGGFLASFSEKQAASGSTLVLYAGMDEDPDAIPNYITIKLSGPGRAEVTRNANSLRLIDKIELFDTTLATSLTITANTLSGFSVERIFTHLSSEAQHMGSISLGPQFSLGYGTNDTTPDLAISGKILNINLGAIREFSTIELGKALPYNIPKDETTPDTYNNKPNLTAGNVLGPGVLIDVTGDGTPGGVGGGGFGKVVINSWAHAGTLRTTQSIGSFTILQGDFLGILEVDKFGNGESTEANVGSMTVANGDWGSSGTEIEGNIGSFSAEAFLAGASIKAGSVTKFTTQEGGFEGTLTLTDTDAKGVATFTVDTDFTGKVESLSPLKKLVIRGDFKGSLKAPSIASITAFAFYGATTGDTEGNADKLNITTTAGLLGQIRAKSGIVSDFEFSSPGNFSGIKVVLSKLTTNTVGISNVDINAANIGPITVQLSALASAAGVNLTGIKDSTFSTDGKMGNVTVKLAGASGHSVGLEQASFTGGSIGNVTVNVAKGTLAGATAQAVDAASFNSSTAIGAFSILGDATTDQASNLQIFAFQKVKSVSVKSKTAAFGSLVDSTILAGRGFSVGSITDPKLLNSRLAASALGPVTVSGDLETTLIASGGNIGNITVGGAMSRSTVLSGAVLGTDRAVGGGDDSFNRHGGIGAVIVKGAFDRSSLSAGVNISGTVIGDANDVLGDSVAGSTQVAAIKSVNLGAASGGILPNPASTHSYAVQGPKIGKFTIGGVVTDLQVPVLIDAGSNGEDAADVIVRQLTATPI